MVSLVSSLFRIKVYSMTFSVTRQVKKVVELTEEEKKIEEEKRSARRSTNGDEVSISRIRI